LNDSPDPPIQENHLKLVPYRGQLAWDNISSDRPCIPNYEIAEKLNGQWTVSEKKKWMHKNRDSICDFRKFQTCVLIVEVSDEDDALRSLKAERSIQGRSLIHSHIKKSAANNTDNSTNMEASEISLFSTSRAQSLIRRKRQILDNSEILPIGNPVCRCFRSTYVIINQICHIPANYGGNSVCGKRHLEYEPAGPWESFSPEIQVQCVPNAECVRSPYYLGYRCLCRRSAIWNSETHTCSGMKGKAFPIITYLLIVAMIGFYDHS